MIGNDIVCLSTANRSKHIGSKRFLDKIFTVEEQVMIVNSEDPNLIIWKLWAVKESAYKLFVQQGFQPEFAPKKIICKKANEHFQVSMDNFKTSVDCIANTKFVYAQTILEKSKVISSCFELDSNIYYNQSQQVSLALKKNASLFFQIDVRLIQLNKAKNNIPKLSYKNTFLPVNVSLTHHGSFGAFAVVLA
ncbi:4'-phosphopantetheinyl transferase superfamily protein [Paucihalobacter ruber]|uniref:4'-phosphopantetheinyl transferase superfamily protein n=1 Tax=Paucihalobacter ruber TaxID=2567861 RepID=A0A506PLX5_9FLAO|nr:4'-phosphopantetheinyl transferase superfamily protein [Paucihalobacter ruber]TPV34856.1 4'-phosphopantetheinyl transferase superfamily protein [Paucihalobacter ruber]